MKSSAVPSSVFRTWQSISELLLGYTLKKLILLTVGLLSTGAYAINCAKEVLEYQ